MRHIEDYDAGRFVDVPYIGAPWSYLGDVSIYGEACVSRRYIVHRWTDLFDLADFIEDRRLCPQNVIVVKKRVS